MKKLFTVLAVFLLALTLLWGCNANTDTPADIPLYYNLDRGATLTADETGAYTVNFALGAEKKTYKVTDEALLAKLLQQDFLGLLLEGDTVTGMVSMWDMPYSRLAQDYPVQSLGGNIAKFNSSISMAGDEVMVELSEDMAIYDFSPLSATPGAITQLQKNDRASVIADENGTVKYVYVTYRAATLDTEKIHCQHCDANTYWYEWNSTTDLPTGGGHYILMNDINMISDAKVANVDICLDLNGKTVTQTSYGKQMYVLNNGGTFNMYGGRIVGGKHINIGYDSINIEGGAAIRVEGIVTIHDGIIEGGDSWTDGGIFYLGNTAKLVMKGGTITGGKSATRGSGVFATGFSTVTLSGNAKVIGNEGSNLWIDAFAKVYIGDEGLGEEAEIGISMTENGDFLSGAPVDADIAKHFISDDASKKVVNTGDGT